MQLNVYRNSEILMTKKNKEVVEGGRKKCKFRQDLQLYF